MIWCWFRLPETKDRSFGEIDLLFVSPPESAREWCSTNAKRIADVQENKVPARKFKYTDVDRESPPSSNGLTTEFTVLHDSSQSISEKKDADEHAEYA